MKIFLQNFLNIIKYFMIKHLHVALGWGAYFWMRVVLGKAGSQIGQ